MTRDPTTDSIELKIGLSVDELISAVNDLNTEEREFLLENLLAATSPEYLASIREAREDYRHGRTLSHDEVFSDSERE